MMDTFLSTNLDFSIRINKLVEKKLQASVCEFTLDIEFDKNIDSDTHRDHITMLRWWIDNILDNCVAYSIKNNINTSMFEELENNLMFCPEEPHDYLLLLLVVAKINAIGNDVYRVISSCINNNSSLGFGNNLFGDPLDMLPDADNWMGLTRYYDLPWWDRPDGSMLDMPVLEGDDPKVKPDILIDLRKAAGLESVKKPSKESKTKPAKIIKPNFKPTIIKKD